MQQLLNNCRAGNISVTPSNWKTVSANYKTMWRISYWFYDDTLGKKKKIVIKGMNSLTSLKEKQATTAALLLDEKGLIEEKHWNHITGEFFIPVIQAENDITEHTPFIAALKKALLLVKVEPKTKTDITNKIANIEKAAKKLNIDNMPVGKVRRKNLVFLLEQMSTVVKHWTANNYNSYRKYLSLLYNKLRLIEAVDTNHIKDIPKQKTIKRIRLELTSEQRIKINKHLHDKYNRFWIFLHIFFHSGSRESELMRIQGKDVNLETQYFKRTIKKGAHQYEKLTPIKDLALPFWKLAMDGCGPEDYVFSKRLKPGPVLIAAIQISKRWNRLVKKKLQVSADFYSLKHSNLDETAELLSLIHASEMAGHKTPIITLDYTYGEKVRQDNRLKKVNNSFA